MLTLILIVVVATIVGGLVSWAFAIAMEKLSGDLHFSSEEEARNYVPKPDYTYRWNKR